MFSNSIEVNHSRQRITSDKEVRFRMGGEFAGRASRMVALLDRDIFVLSRGVRIRSTSPDREPVELRAKRLTYNRQEHLVRAEGGVVFRRGNDYLRADRIHFYLTEDEKTLRFISGKWGLSAGMTQDFGQGIVRTSEIEADEFSVLFDEQGDPLEIELLGTSSGVATLRSTNEASVVRTMTAPTLSGQFENGELVHAEAWEGVRIREYLTFAPEMILRWVCGQRAVVDFNSDGDISEAVFEDRVEFRQGQAVAHADRIDMSEEPYLIRMTGNPSRFENAPRSADRSPHYPGRLGRGGPRHRRRAGTLLPGGQHDLALGSGREGTGAGRVRRGKLESRKAELQVRAERALVAGRTICCWPKRSKRCRTQRW